MAMSFFTFAFTQGCVACWLWAALGPQCTFRTIPGIIVRVVERGPGPRVRATPGMPRGRTLCYRGGGRNHPHSVGGRR
jgi:hypothetical protein